ncbi:MAG: hypothetical protein HY390_01750, partial [Deltaproteobacteria bacterium]|nr:hypothetical protein [Deltaproteobacteria bacterium]
MKGEPEGTEGVREPVGSYSSSTSSSTLERISTRLENDDFEERKRAVAELVAFIKREKDARPQEVAWARVELSRVLNGTYGDLLSETQRNQFNTLPLTQAERNALARGETLENGLLGLTPEERKKLEDYMWRRGQMITDVVNAERLVHEPWNPVPIDPALEAKEGEVIITNRAKQEAWKKIQREGTHGWEEFQQDRWNSIALQLEKAGIKGTLPTYQKLTQTQKDKLIRTLYDRSAEVALKIWQALPKQGLTQAQLDGMTVLRDDVRVFNPNEASSLKTKITQSANKLSRKADVFSQDDRGADSAMFPSPDQKISMKDYLALPVEHLDPAQVAELNETQQTIRGMKQEIAVTLLESPPLARQEIKDKDYTRYRMQQALGAAMQQAHEAVQTSLQASDDIAQDAVNNFETYRDKTIKVFQAIVDRLPESEREDFVPFLSSLKEPKTISGFGLALKKAESQLNEVQAPLEDRFATQYAQERAATRNLMDMVNDDGAYLSPETSQKAYQDLLSVYKGQSEFGEFDTVLHMGLDHRSPVVQKMALEEARAAYASSPQKLKETYVGYLERTMQADLEAEVKALCDGSLSESNTALVFRSHADQLRTRASGQKSNDALSAEKMSRVLGGYLSVLQRSPNCDQAERVAAELAEITGSTFVSELIPHKRELVGQMAAYCEESKKREGAVSPICKSLQDNHLHIPVAYQQDDAGRRQYAQGRVVACAQDSAYGVRVQDEAVYVCEAPNQTLLGMELSELHEDVGDAVNFYAKTHALSNDEAQKKLRSDYLQALRQKMVESLLQNLEISSSFVDAPKLQMAVEALSGLQNCGLQTPASAQLAQNFTQKINTASAHNQTATEVRERFLRSLLHINEDGVMEAYGPNDENAMEDFKNFVVLQDRKRSKTAAALSERDEQERLRIAQGPYGFLLDPYFKESIEAKAQFYGILPAFYEAAIPRGSRAKVGLAEVDQKIRLARQTGQPLKVSYWGSQETGGVQTYPIEVPTYDELQAQLKDKFHRHYDAIMNEMQRYCTQMSCQELDGTYDPGQFEQFQQSAIDASPLLEVATVGLRKSKDVLQACKTGESPDVNRDRTAAVLLLMRNENLRQAVLNDHPEYADLDCGLFLDVKAKTTEWPTLKAVLGQADMLATAALVTAAAVTTGGVGGAVVGGALGTLYTADAYGDWKAASATRVESSGAHYAHAMGTRATRAGQTLDQFAQANEDEKAAATQFYVAAGLTVLDVGVGAGALRRMLARERAVNQMAEQIGQSRNLQAQLGAFSAKDGNAAAIRRAGSAQRAFAEQVVDREMGKPVSALARGWKDYYGEGARRSRRPMRSTVASGSVEPLDVRPKVSETPIVDAGKTRSQWRVPSEASSKESAEVLPMESSGGLGKSQSAVSAKGSASVAEAPKATAPQAKATPAVEASDESLFRSTGETPVVSRPKVAEAPKATAPQAKATPAVEASDESLFRSTGETPVVSRPKV